MTSLFSNTSISANITDKNDTKLPEGWFASDEPGVAERGMDIKSDELNTVDRQILKINLPLAAQNATEIISELQERLGICIPESYLRIEANRIFHFLFFVSQEDYHSPKLMSARMQVKDHARREDRFDMRFSFCNLEENARKNVITANGYNLKHIQTDCDGL